LDGPSTGSPPCRSLPYLLGGEQLLTLGTDTLDRSYSDWARTRALRLVAAERVVVVIAVDTVGCSDKPPAGLGDALSGADEPGGDDRRVVRLIA
jgi:hypothetical protein